MSTLDLGDDAFFLNPNVNQKFKIKVDLLGNPNEQGYSPYANRFLVYK
jgi:hypothetical protein